MSTHIAALRDFPQRSALLHDLSSHMPPLPSLPLPVPFLHHSIFGLIDGNKERLQVFENELNELKKEHNNNTQRGSERSGHSASPTHVTSTVDSDHSTSGSSSSGSSPAQSSEGRHNVIVRNEHGPTVGQKRKKELVKDDAYWERRRKNNDAAKRSRDSRRQKEDEIAQRAASLEMENNALRSEVEQLRVETEQLRLLLRHQPSSLSSLKAPVAIRPSMPIGPAMGSIPHMHASLPQSVPCSLSMGGLSTPLTPLLLPAPAPAAVPNINGLMTVAPLSLGGRSVITSLSSSAPRSTVLVSAHKSE